MTTACWLLLDKVDLWDAAGYFGRNVEVPEGAAATITPITASGSLRQSGGRPEFNQGHAA
jgi:hypothetical protein